MKKQLENDNSIQLVSELFKQLLEWQTQLCKVMIFIISNCYFHTLLLLFEIRVLLLCVKVIGRTMDVIPGVLPWIWHDQWCVCDGKELEDTLLQQHKLICKCLLQCFISTIFKCLPVNTHTFKFTVFRNSLPLINVRDQWVPRQHMCKTLTRSS